jgi:hypothetical protein
MGGLVRNLPVDSTPAFVLDGSERFQVIWSPATFLLTGMMNLSSGRRRAEENGIGGAVEIHPRAAKPDSTIAACFTERSLPDPAAVAIKASTAHPGREILGVFGVFGALLEGCVAIPVFGFHA